MSDRRKGTTHFWKAFWLLLYGERRSQKDRRNPEQRSFIDWIVHEGCGGSCNQGRKPCNCQLKRRFDHGNEEKEE